MTYALRGLLPPIQTGALSAGSSKVATVPVLAALLSAALVVVGAAVVLVAFVVGGSVVEGTKVGSAVVSSGCAVEVDEVVCTTEVVGDGWSAPRLPNFPQ